MKAVNDAHELEYGSKPDVVAKAPGRFHLIGEHSWFFKDKTMSGQFVYFDEKSRSFGTHTFLVCF